MRKIYVVGGQNGYANWMEGQITRNMEDADLVVFTGGEDVDPSIYGQPRHPSTYSNLERDLFEKGEFEKAKKLGKPCLGICRGSQFMCAMNGGILVQDQNNPAFMHAIHTYDNKVLEITSTHHQAAYPYNLPEANYRVLGWTQKMLPYHQGGKREELAPEKECEIVYYPKGRCLGIQGHPEMLRGNHPTISYLRNLLNNFLENKL